MTLTDAIVALQAAGKIASAWLPGMLVREDAFTMRLAYRTTGTWHCVYAHPEKPAMDGWLRVDDRLTVGWQPVLTDPSTVGCLLALVREASGNRSWHCVPYGDKVVCEASAGFGEHFFAPTEGEAIAAALIALAEAA